MPLRLELQIFTYAKVIERTAVPEKSGRAVFSMFHFNQKVSYNRVKTSEGSEKNMKRKGTRSFLKYGLVMAGIMMIYTIVSLYYISQNEKKSYLKNVDYECGTMATEVQAISDNISNMTTFLLAEPDMLSAVRYLTRKDVEKNPVLKNHYLGDIKAH